MPVYVYGCEDKKHGRVDVVHGMTEIVMVACPVCGAKMHRIPQTFRWGFSANSVLMDKFRQQEEQDRRNPNERKDIKF